jgi:hypothetical protein
MVGAACGIGPYSELGKRCSAEHPCGAEYACVNHVCAVAGGGSGTSGRGVNLIENGNFANGTLGWSLSMGTLSTATLKTGSTGLSAHCDASLSCLLHPSLLRVPTALVTTYCASVYLESGSVELKLERARSATMLERPPHGQELRAQHLYDASPSDRESFDEINLHTSLTLPAGTSATIDDYRLWRSETGDCSEH